LASILIDTPSISSIQLLIADERWISCYHTFPFDEKVKKLIESRLQKREIMLADGQYEKALIDEFDDDAHDSQMHTSQDGRNILVLFAASLWLILSLQRINQSMVNRLKTAVSC
jgi:hypothetical protein